MRVVGEANGEGGLEWAVGTILGGTRGLRFAVVVGAKGS